MSNDVPVPITKKRRQQLPRDRVLLANSFSHGEVRALLELFQTLLRGGDGRDIARSARLVNLHAKFLRMDSKYKALSAGGTP